MAASETKPYCRYSNECGPNMCRGLADMLAVGEGEKEVITGTEWDRQTTDITHEAEEGGCPKLPNLRTQTYSRGNTLRSRSRFG